MTIKHCKTLTFAKPSNAGQTSTDLEIDGAAATRAPKTVLVIVSSTLGYVTYIKKIFTYSCIYVIFNTITCRVTTLMKYYFII